MSAFDLSVNGSVALVTGGASGIGRAVADVFGEAGYRLVIADIDREQGEKTAGELAGRGFDAELVVGDLAVEAQASEAVAAGMRRWGRLDFLYNGAGISGCGATIDYLEEADLERVLAVNLKSVFYTCKHAVRHMLKEGGGCILNVASITADTGSPYYPGYGASKAGVMSLTRGLARNLGRHGIRINCLSPGSVSGTNLMRDYYVSHPEERDRNYAAMMRTIPLGRLGQPRDIAHFALFLASPLAAHIHGAVLTIDGGETLRYQ